MIYTKEDLEEYLKCDKQQLGITRSFPRPFLDVIWKYEITLRKYEYWLNKSGTVAKVISSLYKFKHIRQSARLGISIPPNCCGKGLSVAHAGTIQINWKAKIGDNLRIQEGVTIGASGGGAPILGNNVYLGSGCKVIGEVSIADNCAVGANAVVVSNVTEAGITVAGVPAKKISNHCSERFVYFYKYKE